MTLLLSAARARLASARTRAHWRRLLADSTVVILDTETTDLDGQICEIAIITTTGHTLVDTLIRPACPVSPGAQAVHGITNEDLATAPTWAQAWPQIRSALTPARSIVAYNAPFDLGRVRAMCALHSIEADQLLAPERWVCAMRARAAIERSRWRRLDGGHRARGDVTATLSVMHALTATGHTPR